MDMLSLLLLFGRFAILIVFLIVIGSLPSLLLRLKLAKNKNLFECIQCGTCCRIRTISITGDDIKRIEVRGYTDFWEKRGKEKVMKRARGRCVFLKNESCSIHEFKPKICGKFPFFKIYGKIPYCRLWYSCPGIEQLVKDVKGK